MKHKLSKFISLCLAAAVCFAMFACSTPAISQTQFNFNFGQSSPSFGNASNNSSLPKPGNNQATKPGLPAVTPYAGAPTGAPGTQLPKVMYIVNCQDWVSLRSAANTTAPKIAEVPFGAQVTVHAYVSEIYAHCSYNGMSGYIMIQYLGDAPSTQRANYSTPGVKGNAEQMMEYSGFWTIYPDYEPFNGSKFGSANASTVMGDYLFSVGSRRYQVVNCKQFVSLREEANAYSDCIIEVPKGATVDVNGELNKWMLCRYKDHYGWIKSIYLSRK